MFLKDLYHFNKYHFTLLAGFILVSIFLNIKRGVVAAPVFQYGMYASKMNVSDTQHVYVIKINGNTLDQSRYSFVERDVMQTSIYNYRVQATNNTTVYHTMKNIFSKVKAGVFFKEEDFTNKINDSIFIARYRSKLEQITGSSIQALEIASQDLVWKDNNLQPLGSPQKIMFIAPF